MLSNNMVITIDDMKKCETKTFPLHMIEQQTTNSTFTSTSRNPTVCYLVVHGLAVRELAVCLRLQ